MSHHARSSRLIALALATLLLLPAVAPAIEREAVLKRAEVWVEKNTPYSQSGYATTAGDLATRSSKTWRRDCSGFASMCFDIRRADGSTISLDTASLPYHLKPIKKGDLRPGDVILRPKNLVIDGKQVSGGHVVIFVRWVDAQMTRYIGYHERGTKYGTVAQEIRYPYWDMVGFSPYRYKKIENGRLRRSRNWLGPYTPPMTQTTLFALGVQSPSYLNAASAASLSLPEPQTAVPTAP